jgi:protein TonB
MGFSGKRMGSLLEGSEQLERELAQESMVAPATGSLFLHCALFGGLLLYGFLGGLFHHDQWGSPGSGGAIQVSLTGAIPLPSDQPPNENVLSTETPSQAPAEPTPKTKQAVDETAIPISGKQKKAPPQQQSASKTQQHQPQAAQNNLARYGEQAGSSIARGMQSQGGSGPVGIGNGDFGSRFGWYVDGIKRKVSQNWDRSQVNPHTPRGATVQIYFRISRQGNPFRSSFKVNMSSGSSTLDQSCLMATERVDTFGPLPSESHDLWLDVTYNCIY